MTSKEMNYDTVDIDKHHRTQRSKYGDYIYEVLINKIIGFMVEKLLN